jgi:hypothetical protein
MTDKRFSTVCQMIDSAIKSKQSSIKEYGKISDKIKSDTFDDPGYTPEFPERFNVEFSIKIINNIHQEEIHHEDLLQIVKRALKCDLSR